jgi:hypothetical protein
MFIKLIIDEVRAVIVAIKDLHGFTTRIRSARAEKFAGTWGNEGDCTGPIPSHYVELVLSSKGTEVTGIVRSRNLESESELPNGSFIGHRRGFRVTGEIVDVSRGRLIHYGKVSMYLHKGLLEVQATDRLADFLPTQASLWRQSDETV